MYDKPQNTYLLTNEQHLSEIIASDMGKCRNALSDDTEVGCYIAEMCRIKSLFYSCLLWFVEVLF